MITRPTVPVALLLAMYLVGALGGCSSRENPAPVTRLDTTRAHNYDRDVIRESHYTVVPGDTLYSIAFRSSMDLRELAQINNLSEPYTIYPGQTLQIRYRGRAPVSQAGSSRVQTGAVERIEIAEESGGSQAIASTGKTEYGDQQVTQESERQGVAKESVQEPVKEPVREQAQTPTRVPQITQSPQRERAIRSSDIRWQWPSAGQLVARFSTADTGTRGMEFAGQRGDSVVAAAAGRVVYVGSALRGYGQLIILKHNEDYITAYAHNDSIQVREQQWVEAGQQIATMGSTGRDDVRLRFELRLRGNSVNPENYLPRR